MWPGEMDGDALLLDVHVQRMAKLLHGVQLPKRLLGRNGAICDGSWTSVAPPLPDGQAASRRAGRQQLHT